MTERDALVATLEYARDNVPFYRTRIPAGPLDLDSLTHIPTLTRAEVRTQRGRLWSSEGDTRGWRRIRTNGTTGEPVEVILDARMAQAEHNALAAQADYTLGTAGWRGRDIVHLTLHRSAYSRAAWSPFHPYARLAKWNISWAWQLPDERFLGAVRHLEGQVVAAMPSVMALLSERLARLAGQSPVSPMLVLLSGEESTRASRTELAACLGCPVTSLYTLAEAGVVAGACATTDGYHVDEDTVVVEIVDPAGQPAHTGEVVVTPLANRAMPLIRYRTGDRGAWQPGGCGCGRTSPLFRLEAGRRGNVTLAAAGARANVIDFAKLTAQLEVDVVHVGHEDEAVVVEYRADVPVPATTQTVLVAAIQCAVGRPVPVWVRRVGEWSGATEASRNRHRLDPQPFVAPSLLTIEELVPWLRDQLAGFPPVLAAVVTGSAIEPMAMSRFSDIDLTVVVDAEPSHQRWQTLARTLQQQLPILRTNVSTAADLAEAPLVACRLLAEYRPVIGELADCGVGWPSTLVLRAEAVLWAQTARATLWTRLVDPGYAPSDVLREAYLAAKYALDALRYKGLCEGYRRTGATEVVAAAQGWSVPGYRTVLEAIEVAREHRPPPPDAVADGRRYLAAALAVVEWLTSGLRPTSR
jgi:phenylacetate-CoA ligase